MRLSINKPNAGFSLLEAIVALVLLSAGSLALFSWINSNLINLHRLEAAQQRNQAGRNALAFMQGVNPMQNPEGEQVFDAYVLRWQAQVEDKPRDGVSITGSQGMYQLGLYRTEVELYASEALLHRFELWQVGYQQVRFFDADM